MARLKQIAFAGVVALYLVFGLREVVAQPQVQIQNQSQHEPFSVSLVAQLLQQKGLPGMLAQLEKEPNRPFPAIHTKPYCARQPAMEQDSCRQANKLGGDLYNYLRVYQYKIKKLPLSQFSREIKRLALLRDRLWDTKSMGGVMLAYLTNHVIFWELAERATAGSRRELDWVDSLRPHYRDLIRDWKTVAEAASLEGGQPIDLQAIQNATRVIGTPSYSPPEDLLVVRYINIIIQLPKSHHGQGGTIPQVLQNGQLGGFFYFLEGGACTYASYPVILRYYIPLMKKMRQQADFAKHANIPPSLSKDPDAKWVQSMVLRFIPQAIGQKPPGCREAIKWQSFWRILNLVSLHGNRFFNRPDLIDSDFELAFLQ